MKNILKGIILLEKNKKRRKNTVSANVLMKWELLEKLRKN